MSEILFYFFREAYKYCTGKIQKKEKKNNNEEEDETQIFFFFFVNLILS